jgi:hypothetical protein
MSRSGDKTVLRTKISPKRINLNIAGQNTQFLEPDGADVLGFNIPYPLRDLLQSGTFDTTFVNGKMHVARCSIGGITALMVSVKEKQSKVNNAKNVNVKTKLLKEVLLKSPEQAPTEKDVEAAPELAKEDAAVEQDTSIAVSDSNNKKNAFEPMAEETSEAIATELRALQIPAVVDAVDTAFNAAFSKTPTEAIGDATKKTASRVYEAGEEFADLAEDIAAEATSVDVDALDYII